MSSSKDAPDHPLAHNWNRPSVSRSDQASAPPTPNPKQQQFFKKRRESILAIAPDIHPTNQRKLAIKCENVCLTYGEGENTNYVLNGLSLSVPKGEIYGLLGPSGCGKTSLLKIICGLQKVEYGSVKLFGFTPGTLSSGVPGPGIGYMPQELALQSDLTIGEMLAFYGRLCLLDEKTIAKETDYLVDLLQLPPKDRFISSLSGGQKRRTSLAVTIIHRPRLAILDEPTVGVDPLLCQTIWKLLIDLSTKEKMTIMITTHYIEECKRANLVGFMRKGQILAEGNPERLMEYYDTETLENVFYKLCLNQKQRKTTVQQAHPARRRSIIRTESIKSAAGYHRMSLKRNSEIGLNKGVQDLTPKNKPKFSRQGSFTSSFGEYQQQLAKFQEQERSSKYSTPIGSPQMERDNPFDPNNNMQALKKKSEQEHEQQLELRLIDSQRYKKKPLEDISLLPTHWERFKANYNWNPIITWIWLSVITSYKLGLQTIRQPLFLLILYIFPTFCVASLYLCIGHTPKGIKVGLILDEVKDHRHRWPGFPRIPCNPKDKKVDYDYLFKMYDDMGIKNRTKTGDYEFDYTENIDGIGSYDRLRVPYIPDILFSFLNKEIIHFVPYTNVPEAREAVRVRKISAYVHFKKEFSRSFIERDMFLKANTQKKITNEMIDQGTIHLSGDFSDLFMSSSIQLSLLEALVDTYPQLAKECGLQPKSVAPPLEIGEFIYGEYIKGDYFGVRDFAAPGFIMCITYSLSMGLCTLQTMMELEDKMFIRNFSVGLSAGQMVVSNILGRIFFLFGSVSVMLLSAVNLFQIPIYGSWIDAFHILILQTLVGMTNGLFFATLIVDLTACLFVSIGFLLLIFFISGVFWPLEALPYYIRWFSRSMPFTVPGEAFRTVLIRKGAPVSYIYPGILMSYVWLFVFLSLSYWSVKRKKYTE